MQESRGKGSLTLRKFEDRTEKILVTFDGVPFYADRFEMNVEHNSVGKTGIGTTSTTTYTADVTLHGKFIWEEFSSLDYQMKNNGSMVFKAKSGQKEYTLKCSRFSYSVNGNPSDHSAKLYSEVEVQVSAAQAEIEKLT